MIDCGCLPSRMVRTQRHPSSRLRLAQTWCDEEETVKGINTDTFFTTDTPLRLLEGVAGRTTAATECEGVTEGGYFIAEYAFSHIHLIVYFYRFLLVTYRLYFSYSGHCHLSRDVLSLARMTCEVFSLLWVVKRCPRTSRGFVAVATQRQTWRFS